MSFVTRGRVELAGDLSWVGKWLWRHIYCCYDELTFLIFAQEFSPFDGAEGLVNEGGALGESIGGIYPGAKQSVASLVVRWSPFVKGFWEDDDTMCLGVTGVCKIPI